MKLIELKVKLIKKVIEKLKIKFDLNNQKKRKRKNLAILHNFSYFSFLTTYYI